MRWCRISCSICSSMSSFEKHDPAGPSMLRLATLCWSYVFPCESPGLPGFCLLCFALLKGLLGIRLYFCGVSPANPNKNHNGSAAPLVYIISSFLLCPSQFSVASCLSSGGPASGLPCGWDTRSRGWAGSGRFHWAVIVLQSPCSPEELPLKPQSGHYFQHLLNVLGTVKYSWWLLHVIPFTWRPSTWNLKMIKILAKWKPDRWEKPCIKNACERHLPILKLLYSYRDYRDPMVAESSCADA